MAAKMIWRNAPYIGTEELALMLNEQAGAAIWCHRRVRRWLLRKEASFKIGRFWFTTRELLREKFPDIWSEVLVRLSEDE